MEAQTAVNQEMMETGINLHPEEMKILREMADVKEEAYVDLWPC